MAIETLSGPQGAVQLHESQLFRGRRARFTRLTEKSAKFCKRMASVVSKAVFTLAAKLLTPSLASSLSSNSRETFLGSPPRYAIFACFALRNSMTSCPPYSRRRQIPKHKALTSRDCEPMIKASAQEVPLMQSVSWETLPRP